VRTPSWTVSECRVEFRVLDESRDLKFSYREINFSKSNIPNQNISTISNKFKNKVM